MNVQTKSTNIHTAQTRKTHIMCPIPVHKSTQLNDQRETNRRTAETMFFSCVWIFWTENGWKR